MTYEGGSMLPLIKETIHTPYGFSPQSYTYLLRCMAPRVQGCIQLSQYGNMQRYCTYIKGLAFCTTQIGPLASTCILWFCGGHYWCGRQYQSLHVTDPQGLKSNWDTPEPIHSNTAGNYESRMQDLIPAGVQANQAKQAA